MKTLPTMTIVVAFMLIGALGFSLIGSAEEGKSVEQMIAAAKTPADHEALAAYYDKEAKDALAKQATHLKMAEYYKKNPALNKSAFSTHCDIIASDYKKAAKQYEDLAELHREMAKTAK